MKPLEQGWNTIASWYDEYLQGDDTYQAQVILPNVIRMVAPHNGMRILDLACGQGYFARALAQTGAQVVGIDASEDLLGAADAQSHGLKIIYKKGNVEKLDEAHGVYDAALCVLALENIKNIQAMMGGVADALKSDGRLVLVMLHPAFRIPKHSDWSYSKEHDIQYRKVGKYLSEVSIPIELHPHKGKASVTTTTYHRPMQWYMKAFRNAGFAITNMEEWISHKKSQPGPRQAAEDTARKEFPMFMALELRKII